MHCTSERLLHPSRHTTLFLLNSIKLLRSDLIKLASPSIGTICVHSPNQYRTTVNAFPVPTLQAYNKYGMLRNGVREHKQVELGMKLEHTKHTHPNADID